MDFIRNVYILSKLDQKPVLDFHWILYWIIGGFLLNIKSTRFYVKSTRFPHLARVPVRSERPILSPGDPIVDLGFSKKNSRIVDVFCSPQSPFFCPISSVFDRFGHYWVFLCRYTWFWLQNLVLGLKFQQELTSVEFSEKKYTIKYTNQYMDNIVSIFRFCAI